MRERVGWVQRGLLVLSSSPQADRDCEALRAELNRVAAQVREQEAAMEEHAAQISQLQGAIAEAEQVGARGVGWPGGMTQSVRAAGLEQVQAGSARLLPPTRHEHLGLGLVLSCLLAWHSSCCCAMAGFPCVQARLKLKREHDAVVGERDALGTQVGGWVGGWAGSALVHSCCA